MLTRRQFVASLPRSNPVDVTQRVTAKTLIVTVVCAIAPRQVSEIQLQLPTGSTVADALRASGLLALQTASNVELNTQSSAEYSADSKADLDIVNLGIWGRKATPHQVLRDLDRVEIYRALKVDPKVARRARFAKQGAKTAGLFAKLRDGAKSGY